MHVAYSMFGHHLQPQATFLPNFISVVALTAELACWEKSRTQSIKQSLIPSLSLFDAPGTEAFASENLTAGLYEWVSECVGFNVPLDT